MYLYFDVNGNLKEIIYNPVREGNTNVNKIYIYVEPENVEPVGGTYPLPTRFPNAKINFANLEGENLNPNGGNSVPLSKVTGQIPNNPQRDLYFFKYGYNYEFWSCTLPSTASAESGVVTASGILYNQHDVEDTEDDEELYLNKFNFNVEASVGVVPDSTMTKAQYAYLYNAIMNLGIGNYVPYTGAEHDLDLSVLHKLYFGSNYYIGVVNEHLYFNAISGDIILSPDDHVFIGSISNSNKVAKKGDLSDYLAYAGATRDVNMAGYQMTGLGDTHIKPRYGSTSYSNWLYFETSDTTDDNTAIRIRGDGYTNLYIQGLSDSGATVWSDKIALQSQLPKQGQCATFSTGSFTLQAGGNYAASNISVSNFIEGSNMLVITWDNCFALCPIPVSGAGRVVAALWNANGEAQTIRVRYELKDSNTKLDISLQGGFIPPSNHTAYVFCYKLFN